MASALIFPDVLIYTSQNKEFAFCTIASNNNTHFNNDFVETGIICQSVVRSSAFLFAFL